MALFITFEGGEGSGKTLQTRALHRKLAGLAIPALLTHEPGGTPTGEKIARWLKQAQEISISPLTELLMFNASRAQLVEEVIQPNLKMGKVVICDRYADSTIAYQSWGRGLDLELVRTVNNAATRGLKPALTVLLDIQAETGLTRKEQKGHDRFEQEDIIFHRRVKEGYLKLANDEPERWLVIDASQSKAKIRNIIWQRVSQLL
ncbi:MAG: dTMP kinase [Dehalococcoidales bacterium]